MPVRAALVRAAGRALRLGFRTSAVDPAAVRSIVVIKPCCLGDLLLATPSLAALRQAYPHAYISLAVSSWARPAVENSPHVDALIDCEGFAGQRWLRWSAYRRFVTTLRAGSYDLAIVLDRSLFASLAAWRAGIPLRVGIDSGGRGFSLTGRVPWNQERHETDLYLDVMHAASVPVSVAGQPFYRPAAIHQMFADRVFEEWQLNDRGPVVVIHPGGGSNPGMKLEAKRWPATRYAALADRLVDTVGAQVVVVGHASDAPVARQMRMAMRHEGPDLVGQTSFGQLAAVIERGDLYIGNDAGTTHLASAVDTPVVALFGPTNPTVYGPRSEAGAALFHADACPLRERRALGAVSACPGCQCVKAITVDEVQEEAVRLLQTHVRARRTPTERT
ncbi:MAG: lipopolysaccharide heptosyltransferase II [Dehalococcoidia bacterium]|nr:lipopolysaccharide heptosyltransferase II [Dehalococcoidia bacterium]